MNTKKLCLGTVQFGLEYGINNKTGKPTKYEVFEMLDAAIYRGVTCLDTASAYGDAEELLGEYVKSRRGGESLKLISKLSPSIINEEYAGKEHHIEKEIIKTINVLNVSKLNGYMIHNPSNIYNKYVLSEMVSCKKSGYVENIGVSIYEPQQAVDAVKTGIFDYIQIPYNIFDRRLDRIGFFKLAEERNIQIFARSAFIQGLLLKDVLDLPDYLLPAKKHLIMLDKVIMEFGLKRQEAAFLYVYKHPNIDYLVFGVDTIAQLNEIIDISESRIDYSECFNELKRRFTDVEEIVISPAKWGK